MLVDLLHQLSPTGTLSSPRLTKTPSKQTINADNKTKTGDYTFEKTIGEGSFGKVKLATHIISGKKVAIKCIEKSEMIDSIGSAERVLREIILLSHLRHPNICKLLQVMDDAKVIFLAMEYESSGELFNLLIKYKRYVIN